MYLKFEQRKCQFVGRTWNEVYYLHIKNQQVIIKLWNIYQLIEESRNIIKEWYYLNFLDIHLNKKTKIMKKKKNFRLVWGHIKDTPSGAISTGSREPNSRGYEDRLEMMKYCP